MNPGQIIILILAVTASSFILWHDLPIEIPWVIFKVFMLIIKLSLLLAITIVAYIFAGRKRNMKAE